MQHLPPGFDAELARGRRPSRAASFDHLVGAGGKVGGTSRPSALAPPLGRYSAANVITWKEMRESSTSALAAPT